eukprot:GFUD01000200.1.p1 GENE.GFUD01000200.1~~GFUD01000200.1.p1  ORF type:complete len:184 (+),score=48.58 GFUD01000200.1:84-635(+)
MRFKLLVGFLLCGLVSAPDGHGDYGAYGLVELVSAGGSEVSGTLVFQQYGPTLNIRGHIIGLEPGSHGIHIHEKGDTSNDCKAAGGHFNPQNNEHAGPSSSSRHAGDLGNIVTLHGQRSTTLSVRSSLINLGEGGVMDVTGRAIVIHALEDDLGLGVGDKAEGSKQTGNAGARLACAIISQFG